MKRAHSFITFLTNAPKTTRMKRKLMFYMSKEFSLAWLRKLNHLYDFSRWQGSDTFLEFFISILNFASKNNLFFINLFM